MSPKAWNPWSIFLLCGFGGGWQLCDLPTWDLLGIYLGSKLKLFSLQEQVEENSSRWSVTTRGLNSNRVTATRKGNQGDKEKNPHQAPPLRWLAPQGSLVQRWWSGRRRSPRSERVAVTKRRRRGGAASPFLKAAQLLMGRTRPTLVGGCPTTGLRGPPSLRGESSQSPGHTEPSLLRPSFVRRTNRLRRISRCSRALKYGVVALLSNFQKDYLPEK